MQSSSRLALHHLGSAGLGNVQVHEGLAAKVDLIDVAPSHDLVANEPHHAVALPLFDWTVEVEPAGLFPILALRKKRTIHSELEKEVVTRVVEVGNPAVNVVDAEWPQALKLSGWSQFGAP